MKHTMCYAEQSADALYIPLCDVFSGNHILVELVLDYAYLLLYLVKRHDLKQAIVFMDYGVDLRHRWIITDLTHIPFPRIKFNGHGLLKFHTNFVASLDEEMHFTNVYVFNTKTQTQTYSRLPHVQHGCPWQLTCVLNTPHGDGVVATAESYEHHRTRTKPSANPRRLIVWTWYEGKSQPNHVKLQLQMWFNETLGTLLCANETCLLFYHQSLTNAPHLMFVYDYNTAHPTTSQLDQVCPYRSPACAIDSLIAACVSHTHSDVVFLVSASRNITVLSTSPTPPKVLFHQCTNNPKDVNGFFMTASFTRPPMLASD